jgi:hypothetical protein
MGFDSARRAALLDDLLRLVKGRPAELLPFEQVRNGLKLTRLVDRGVEEVPLDRIVGSVGRPHEFNRAFRPRKESLRARWSEVEALAEGPRGFPPVDLYRVGEAYFVVDGHHRVSVARSLGARTIEARVKEFLTPVPVGPNESIEQLLLKGALADFLEVTVLTPSEPDEFRATVAHGAERLVEHINVHAYYRGVETGREVPWREAVESWRTAVYRPMVEAIRASGIMADFPSRTETDLYLFLMDHLHRLRERHRGRPVGPEAAVRHFRWVRRLDRRRGRSRRARKELPGRSQPGSTT